MPRQRLPPVLPPSKARFQLASNVRSVWRQGATRRHPVVISLSLATQKLTGSERQRDRAATAASHRAAAEMLSLRSSFTMQLKARTPGRRRLH